jgi:two-component system KDP operon response regulator KdpE
MTEAANHVLVIEDEPQLRRFLRTGFELEGHAVYEAASAGDGIKQAALRPIDLLVVDLGLPDMEGSAVVERVRTWSTVPIIVLSVTSNEETKVRLLELGADDYVVKPFGMAELLARAKAALRRRAQGASPQPVVHAGPLAIDLADRVVRRAGELVALTPKEYRLVQVLAQHLGKVVTHEHLLREIWGRAHSEDHHYLRILVRKVRQKVEEDATRPRLLVTELGVGYRLVDPQER